VFKPGLHTDAEGQRSYAPPGGGRGHKLIADRTALALKHMRSDGKVYPRIPFGWREASGKRLVPVPVEQKALSAAKKTREAGNSFQAIADYLAKTVKPKGDGKWYPASARQVLMSTTALEVA
jgi:hypothetical protein